MKFDLLLIDFDGVISKNSVRVMLSIAHRAMNKLTPMPMGALIQALYSTSCQPPVVTSKLTFHSLGLSEKDLEKYFMELISTDEFEGEKIKIEEDFYSFITYCNDNDLKFKIFSTGSVDSSRFADVVKKYGNEIFYDLTDKYKSNPVIYKELLNEFELDPQKVLHIDDSPLALRTSKIVGMQTIMMLNDIFDEKQYDIYHEYIDHKVDTFNELQKYIENL